jgi:hypothetical protein
MENLMGRKGSWTTSQLHEALDVYEQQLRDSGLRRNTINTYVQHPERFIRWLDNDYTPIGPRSNNQEAGVKPRSKYDPLCDFLVDRPKQPVTLGFTEVEAILGFALPASARRHQAWWANEREGTHSHARAWLEASYETRKLDLNSRTVTFVPRS